MPRQTSPDQIMPDRAKKIAFASSPRRTEGPATPSHTEPVHASRHTAPPRFQNSFLAIPFHAGPRHAGHRAALPCIVLPGHGSLISLSISVLFYCSAVAAQNARLREPLSDTVRRAYA